jgi:predicted RNA polymerase sigma factor
VRVPWQVGTDGRPAVPGGHGSSHLLPATRADLLARLARIPEALAAYDDAIALATNHVAAPGC